MKDFLYAPIVAELADTCANMYRLGWDERNGGNISVLLNENEITEYIDPRNVLRSIPIGFSSLNRRIFAFFQQFHICFTEYTNQGGRLLRAGKPHGFSCVPRFVVL